MFHLNEFIFPSNQLTLSRLRRTRTLRRISRQPKVSRVGSKLMCVKIKSSSRTWSNSPATWHTWYRVWKSDAKRKVSIVTPGVSMNTKQEPPLLSHSSPQERIFYSLSRSSCSNLMNWKPASSCNFLSPYPSPVPLLHSIYDSNTWRLRPFAGLTGAWPSQRSDG